MGPNRGMRYEPVTVPGKEVACEKGKALCRGRKSHLVRGEVVGNETSESMWELKELNGVNEAIIALEDPDSPKIHDLESGMSRRDAPSNPVPRSPKIRSFSRPLSFSSRRSQKSGLFSESPDSPTSP